MGHEHCGAVKAAIDDIKLGNITAILQKIKPTVASITYEGERNSENQEICSHSF
jgi:carbonic anhydrase